MAQSYSARSRAIEPFHVMALLARANELQAAGHDVIHLEIGEPDFTTAEPIIRAGQAALALLDEKLRTNPDLYPSEEDQKRLHLPKALDQKALKLWSQAWDRAKGLR